jgi:molecular chaperone GrpE
MNSETERGATEPEEAFLPDADIVEEASSSSAEELEALSPEELLQRERDEYLENWRRVQADFQNHRRRQVLVIEAAVTGARRELFGELLLVLDYLDMALKSPVETTEGKNLLMGVQMTRDQMMRFLEAHEVERIDSSGTFDPTRHEAIETVAAPNVAPGTIVETVRSGYAIGKDVLRYAHVKVAADSSVEADREES